MLTTELATTTFTFKCAIAGVSNIYDFLDEFAPGHSLQDELEDEIRETIEHLGFDNITLLDFNRGLVKVESSLSRMVSLSGTIRDEINDVMTNFIQSYKLDAFLVNYVDRAELATNTAK
jgi:hypothetical protein